MNQANPWDEDNTHRCWPEGKCAPTVSAAFARNRAQRRALAKPKARPVYGGRSLIGNPICTKETYDGTAFLAQALGKPAIGPHHVRNAMKRLRREMRAA